MNKSSNLINVWQDLSIKYIFFFLSYFLSSLKENPYLPISIETEMSGPFIKFPYYY